MLTRRTVLGAMATTLAAPAIVNHAVLGQALRKVKLGSAFTTTTNAMFLMPDLLKPEGIDAEVISFPSLVQRMQAVASGAVDVGNGGLSATMQLATKGFPMALLANGCDGGWMLVAQKSITSMAQLAGKKVGVQNGSIGLVSLLWKLRDEKLDGKVELVYLDNQDQPTPLARGDLAAICCFEPYATFAEMSGFGHKLWVPYDTPMGKTNLGFVSSVPFLKKDPALTKTLVQAHVKATNTMKNDPSIAIATTIKQFNMSPEIAKASTENLFFSADTGPAFQSGLKSLAKMMIGGQDAGCRAQLGRVHQHQLPVNQTLLPLPLGEGRSEASAKGAGIPARAPTPRRLPNRAIGLLPILALLALWQLAVSAELYPPVLLPAPLKVVGAFVQWGPDIAANAAASLLRVIVGVGLAFVVAVPAGLLIGRYELLDRLTDWSIQTFRSIPPISLIPLAMLFFGIGDTPAIVLIFLSALWPLLINTIFGVRGIERTLLKVATAARASELLILRDIILPAATPAILTGLRLAIGGGWLTVVTAEMIAVKSGLGYMILNAQMTFRTELIFAGIIVIGAIGLLADQAVRLLRARICRWQEGLVSG